jgi:hypothetical protein
MIRKVRGKNMLDIVKMSEDLRTRLQREADAIINDRLTMRDVLEARVRELADKRDKEIARVDAWALQQRQLIHEIFTALLLETENDRLKNNESLQRMTSEARAPETASAHLAHTPHTPHPSARTALKSFRHLNAAE